MDHTFPHRIAQDVYSQHKPRRVGLDAGVAIRGGTSADMDSSKFNEKELMHGLNDRLAGFIEKVHQLEYHNHLLESEIQDIRGKAKPASCLEEEYGAELGKLRQLVQDITHQKHQIEIEHQNLEEELSNLRRQHKQEAKTRSDAESSIMVLKKDINDAYQAKLQLDKKAQSLVDEIHFLKRNHEAEVSEMCDQIQDAQVTVAALEFGHPGVTAALRDIRAQLEEGHAVPDVQQMGETFRSQFARLTEAAATKREALKATQQEIQEYRRRLQAKNIELDCAKGTREAMEKQLHDVEDRHKEEVIHYQNTIKELENELINCKFDMSAYLREYQDLLNVKMALDVEILSYRKLLCGEESRLSAVSDTHISLPYIYHQSPIYTLPCHSRPGGPHRRAEPHYKFVEEIITETTREIEMSEFEETGSEETEVEKDEQECTKRDTGSSKEEDYNKDSGEAEDNQVSDGQQNESVGNLVNGDVDGDGESPVEGGDGEKGEKNKEEPGDGDMGTNIQNKDLLSESLKGGDSEHHKIAENPEEKEAVVTVVTGHTDVTSVSHDSKAEVSVEGERLKTTGDGKQGHAEEDSSISAVAKKPADETSARMSEESNKTEEQSTGVQDKVNTVVPVTAEKTSDSPAETKSTLPKGTGDFSEKAQIISSTASNDNNKEKESSHTKPKEISISDAGKGEDKEAKSIQDAKHESNKEDKESSLESTVKSLPEAHSQTTGDKSQTIKTAEIKELQQGAPESSSQVQKPTLSEDSHKK